MESKIFDAIDHGNLLKIKELIPQDYSTKFHNHYLLHYACDKGQYSIVKYLLEQKFPPNDLNSDSFTPLMLACLRRRIPVIKLLINRGSLVDFQNKRGQTALMIASQEGDIEVVQMLLSFDAIISIQDHEGQRALDYAQLHFSQENQQVPTFFQFQNNQHHQQQSRVHLKIIDLLSQLELTQELEEIKAIFEDPSLSLPQMQALLLTDFNPWKRLFDLSTSQQQSSSLSSFSSTSSSSTSSISSSFRALQLIRLILQRYPTLSTFPFRNQQSQINFLLQSCQQSEFPSVAFRMNWSVILLLLRSQLEAQDSCVLQQLLDIYVFCQARARERPAEEREFTEKRVRIESMVCELFDSPSLDLQSNLYLILSGRSLTPSQRKIEKLNQILMDPSNLTNQTQCPIVNSMKRHFSSSSKNHSSSHSEGLSPLHQSSSSNTQDLSFASSLNFSPEKEQIITKLIKDIQELEMIEGNRQNQASIRGCRYEVLLKLFLGRSVLAMCIDNNVKFIFRVNKIVNLAMESSLLYPRMKEEDITRWTGVPNFGTSKSFDRIAMTIHPRSVPQLMFQLEGVSKFLMVSLASATAVLINQRRYETEQNRTRLRILNLLVILMFGVFADELGCFFEYNSLPRFLRERDLLDSFGVYSLFTGYVISTYYSQRISTAIVSGCIFGISIVLLTIGLLKYLTPRKSLGQLIIEIKAMINEILDFLIIAFFIFVGFGVFFMFISPKDGFEGNGFPAMLTLFGWMMNGPPGGLSDDYYIAEDFKKDVALVVMVLFVILTSIVLLNLLIARMTNSFARVDEHSLEEWVFLQVKTMRPYYLVEERFFLSQLPSPGNLGLGVVTIILYPLKSLFQSLLAQNSYSFSYSSFSSSKSTVHISISGTISNFVLSYLFLIPRTFLLAWSMLEQIGVDIMNNRATFRTIVQFLVFFPMFTIYSFFYGLFFAPIYNFLDLVVVLKDKKTILGGSVTKAEIDWYYSFSRQSKSNQSSRFVEEDDHKTNHNLKGGDKGTSIELPNLTPNSSSDFVSSSQMKSPSLSSSISSLDLSSLPPVRPSVFLFSKNDIDRVFSVVLTETETSSGLYSFVPEEEEKFEKKETLKEQSNTTQENEDTNSESRFSSENNDDNNTPEICGVCGLRGKREIYSCCIDCRIKIQIEDSPRKLIPNYSSEPPSSRSVFSISPLCPTCAKIHGHIHSFSSSEKGSVTPSTHERRGLIFEGHTVLPPSEFIRLSQIDRLELATEDIQEKREVSWNENNLKGKKTIVSSISSSFSSSSSSPPPPPLPPSSVFYSKSDASISQFSSSTMLNSSLLQLKKSTQDSDDED